MTEIAAPALTTPERSRLDELEAVVKAGLQTFIDVGLALREIRDKRLYRDTHATFGAYCHERWGWGGRRGRQIIAAAEIGTIVPVGNEAQARELAPLRDDEAAIVDVWHDLREHYGDDVTAERIKLLVHRRIEIEAHRAEVDEKADRRQQENEDHVRRWQEFAAALEPGQTVWHRPEPDAALEDEIAAAEQVQREADDRLRVAKAELERARKRARKLKSPAGPGLCLLSPGSQFMDEGGHTYVSPDGESVVYVGRREPHRPAGPDGPAWAAWGFEAAGDSPA